MIHSCRDCGKHGRDINGQSDQLGSSCPVTGVAILKIEGIDGIQEVGSPLHGWGQGSSLDTNVFQQNQQPQVINALHPALSSYTSKRKG